MQFVGKHGCQVGVPHIARGEAEHHSEHAEDDSTVGEQLELAENTHLRRHGTLRQHHEHDADHDYRQHVDDDETGTPTRQPRNPRTHRHAEHGGDGKSGEHP